ncbi:hypothetical protein CBA19CS22_34475 [Caballeronia novacaledonica]|uniref:Uncharacterized protein n=1 Tax=Caballeronia novacaledonica TaxID=1544861 RepID=A0ACB5R2X6_9BURK|nr:hypothetical protein CBA19CS22_34475 [Caballeronia novacaledonica]
MDVTCNYREASSATSDNNAPPHSGAAPDPLRALLAALPANLRSEPRPAVVIGELIALIQHGRVPLVFHPNQSDHAALRAATVVDLQRADIGRRVVLVFDEARASCPIIVGVLREHDSEGWPSTPPVGLVEMDAGGTRMIVSAKHELILRCGKASIELRHDGRIEIKGDDIVTEATGANRIRGGSVEMN